MPKFLLDFAESKSLIYIDANVFHLHLRNTGKVGQICTSFLSKIETKKIQAFTSPLVVDELAYKLLLKCIEIEFKKNPLNIIRENPDTISKFSQEVSKGIEAIYGIRNLKFADVPSISGRFIPILMNEFKLLPRDALHLEVMRSHGCNNIASTDEDFDRVINMTRWTPLEI